METFSFFQNVMPYLSNPLILIGFLAVLFIGIFYTLLKAKVIRLSARDTSNLLTYSFLIALAAIVGGVVYSVMNKVPSTLPDIKQANTTPTNNNTPTTTNEQPNASSSSSNNNTPNTQTDLEKKIASFKLLGEGEKVKLTFVSAKKGFTMDFDAPAVLDAQTIKNRLISHFEFNKELYDVVGENIRWSLTHNNDFVTDENTPIKDMGWKKGDIVKLFFQSGGNVARGKKPQEF